MTAGETAPIEQEETPAMNTAAHTQSATRGNSASAPLEALMAVSFSSVPSDNPMLRGSLAAPKQFFGEYRRYAVAPVHTRFGAVEWFVWDAEHALSTMGRAEVIRQEDTLEEALRGL